MRRKQMSVDNIQETISDLKQRIQYIGECL